MQRSVRILRIVLPIAFIAFVGVIVVSWTRSKPRTGGPEAPVQGSRPDDRPRVESKGFEDTQTIAGRVVSRIVARRVVAYASSWNTLEGVQLTIYRPNGLTYELTCPEAQFNSETKEAEAKGGVKVTSSDGIVIETAALHFDGNRLTNKIPVKFSIDEWRGNAGALDLDVGGETLKLSSNVNAATVATRPGVIPMTLAAETGLFRRRENDVEFTANVVLTRQADRVSADRIVGRFAPDRKQLMGIEGQGKVLMSLSSNVGAGENLGGRKDINCDRFFSELGGDGQISALVALGETSPVHAVLEGPPVRDIVAKQIRAALANRAVTEIRAESEVIMKELGPTAREIRSDHVTLSFDPQLHRATNAFLIGNIKYRDPKNTAAAQRANYDIVGDTVVLNAEYGFDPTVTSEGNILKAKQIEFSPRAGTARGTGGVIAQLVSKQGGTTADGTGFFPAGKAVFVNSDMVSMRNATKTANFTGNVRAWQDTNTLFANDLQVQGAGDTITARGNVRTTLYNTDSTGPPRKVPMVSRSEQMTARKNERRIELSGAVKIDDEQRTMTAERATFFFDAARKMERIEAHDKVALSDASTGRKANGDRALYDVARRLVSLFGKPATATDVSGTVSGEQIRMDLSRNKVEVVSPSAIEGTYKPKP